MPGGGFGEIAVAAALTATVTVPELASPVIEIA